MAHLEHFYVEPDAVTDETFVLRAGEFRHAVLVLRKRVGDELAAVDGCGHLYRGVITDISQAALSVRIAERIVNFSEPRLRLTLAPALLKGGHMDEVVERGTELGIATFQPITTLRSIVRSDERLRRWREKALAAMKQCGRSRCPDIRAVRTLAQVLETWRGKSIFIAHDQAEQPQAELHPLICNSEQALLLVGPEGGFDEEEISLAKESGARTLFLGIRRLRSQTAALVAAVRLLTLAGELE
ncbi:16S rRNA (uracil(1498)-N(3))-methyltransferase [candidate division KSB1 bacterium]|nr:16S rRNA (uracil(1498)-N(3))-methyltransferase [candidate division KSB1 bacterium]